VVIFQKSKSGQPKKKSKVAHGGLWTFNSKF
jgi:hypothetical protein